MPHSLPPEIMKKATKGISYIAHPLRLRILEFLDVNGASSVSAITKAMNEEQVIMTYEGATPFMFVQQTASVSDELAIVSVYGEPYQLATSVAAVSDNMISWVSNGIEYYVVADNMSQSDLMNVANSVASMPVSK